MKNFKRIRLLLVLVIIMFVGISLYLVYFQLFEAPDLNKHSANVRNYIDESSIARGSIYDRSGEILARSDEEGNRYNYYYYSTAHLAGYASKEHGKSGLERAYNAQLLGLSEADLMGAIKDVLGSNEKGNNLGLTISAELQSYAYSLLENHKGSIVVMDPKTGAVLAMVSSPSFNVNEVDNNWLSLIEREDGVLLNRSTQGLYTPGSIIKILTSVALLESGQPLGYHDEGVEWINDSSVYNFEEEVYGDISLEEALIYSSNTYFVNKAQRIGPELLKEVSERFYFNKDYAFELGHEQSYIDYDRPMDVVDLAATSYGQGRTLVTPLHMAMVISAISQDGRLMTPYLVEEITSSSGAKLFQARPKELSQATDTGTARKVKEMLVSAVEYNGYNYLSGYKIGGKTGTAENPSDLTHAWYVSFAEGASSDLALAIVLEEEGSTGGRAAAPLAQRIYEKAWELGILD